MLKDLFSKKRKYATVPPEKAQRDVPEGIMTKCPQCKTIMYAKELNKNLKVCVSCGYHYQMNAYERIDSLLDEDSFSEMDPDMTSGNPLSFPGYEEKLEKDRNKTGLNEAIVTGEGKLNSCPLVLAVMDARFRMGSMGAVVGEKITRCVEQARQKDVPFLIFTASGGARMQEGALSLMQMAKTSTALRKFSDESGLFISVMTHPTTGGVTASFASLGDYNFAEPGALIGFAGRRIIEQTIHQELPQDFQTSESLFEHGQLDRVIHRHELRDTLAKVLSIHGAEGES